mgnify:CR=1 FL=1
MNQIMEALGKELEVRLTSEEREQLLLNFHHEPELLIREMVIQIVESLGVDD